MKALPWINFILGLWLILGGFVFSIGAGAIMAEEIVLGLVIAVLAAISVVRPAISWLVALAGLWTLVAPAVMNYAGLGASRGNDIVIGIAVLVLGCAYAVSSESRMQIHA